MNTTPANKKILSRNAKKNIFLAAMLIVPVVHFIIFWGYVNFSSILMAFQGVNPAEGKIYWTLNNFKTVFTMFGKFGQLKTALGNTLLTWAFLTVFLMPWSFLLTYFLYKKIRLSGLWRTALFVPTLLPAIAMTSIFTYILYADAPVGKLIGLVFKTVPAFLVDEKYAKWSVIIYMFLTNFGGSFILISGAMARVPREIIESAYIDGAGMRVELTRILLPLCWPTLSTLLILNTAGIFMATGPVLLLTWGEAKTSTISFWIFNQVFKFQQYYMPAALGLLCTVILFPAVLLVRWGLGKVWADVEF